MSEQRWRRDYAEQRAEHPGPHRHRLKQKKRAAGEQWWAIVAVDVVRQQGRTPVGHAKPDLSAGDACVYCGEEGGTMIDIDQPNGTTEWWHVFCADRWQLVPEWTS